MSKITVSQRQPFLVERFHVKNSIFLDRFHEIFLPKRPPLWEFGPSSNHFHGKINSGLLILQKKIKGQVGKWRNEKNKAESWSKQKTAQNVTHLVAFLPAQIFVKMAVKSTCFLWSSLCRRSLIIQQVSGDLFSPNFWLSAVISRFWTKLKNGLNFIPHSLNFVPYGINLFQGKNVFQFGQN